MAVLIQAEQARCLRMVSKSYTITADPCNHIVDVIVDNVSQGAISSYTFNDVTANHTISASFAPSGPYTINATAGTGARLLLLARLNVGCGGSQTYNITPGVCSHIVDVTVDGTSVGAVTSYTFQRCTQQSYHQCDLCTRRSVLP
jgi:hypothetical protein